MSPFPVWQGDDGIGMGGILFYTRVIRTQDAAFFALSSRNPAKGGKATRAL